MVLNAAIYERSGFQVIRKMECVDAGSPYRLFRPIREPRVVDGK